MLLRFKVFVVFVCDYYDTNGCILRIYSVVNWLLLMILPVRYRKTDFWGKCKLNKIDNILCNIWAIVTTVSCYFSCFLCIEKYSHCLCNQSCKVYAFSVRGSSGVLLLTISGTKSTALLVWKTAVPSGGVCGLWS